MARNKRESKGRLINPTFWVFCEGESEEQYIDLLRSEFRLPIQLVPKVSGQDLNDRKIAATKMSRPTHEKDKTYLMFDLDATGMLERLQQIKKAELLCSNPCFELWLLLHYTEQNGSFKTADCIKALISKEKSYKKGEMGSSMQSGLKENRTIASNRAKKLTFPNNPSTSVFRLIEDLEAIKAEKDFM